MGSWGFFSEEKVVFPCIFMCFLHKVSLFHNVISNFAKWAKWQNISRRHVKKNIKMRFLFLFENCDAIVKNGILPHFLYTKICCSDWKFVHLHTLYGCIGYIHEALWGKRNGSLNVWFCTAVLPVWRYVLVCQMSAMVIAALCWIEKNERIKYI